MIPPTSIDGTDITGATIDGTDVQEITVDGDVVFSSALTFNDAIENDDLSMFTGDTSLFSTTTAESQQGSRSLAVTNGESGTTGLNGSQIISTSGLDNYTSEGDTFEFYMKPGSITANDDITFLFGVQNSNTFYRIFTRARSNSFSDIRKVINGSEGTVDGFSFNLSSQWYRYEVSWTSSSVSFTQFDENNNSVGSASTSDLLSTTDGGLGVEKVNDTGVTWYIDDFNIL